MPRLERAAARRPVLGLAFGGAGAFPRARAATTLWTGVTGDREPLGRLAASVVAAGRRAGAAEDKHGAYKPHLTLARCREVTDLRPLIASLAPYEGTVWTAADLHLIRSHPGPRPRYETLGTWPIGGGRN